MPTKRLSQPLVGRLIQARKKIASRFPKMVNADHRPDKTNFSNPRNPMTYSRVREWAVARNSKTPLIIKQAHDPAAWTIERINQEVVRHNQKFQPTNYHLFSPHAYAIDEQYLAMGKTDRPNVVEILGAENGAGKTERGQKFFARLKTKWRITEKQLQDAANEVNRRTMFDKHNILLIGYRQGKFLFVPLVDLY